MYHRFDFLGGNGLVRSLDLNYQNDDLPEGQLAKVDYIITATQNSHQYKNGNWIIASLPAVTYTYQPIEWDTSIHSVSHESIQGAPQGLTGSYQWIDLEGEGIPGILAEQGDAWYYKNNLGNAQFAPSKPVAQKPSFSGMSADALSLQDLNADGRRQIVADKPIAGFWELDDWKGQLCKGQCECTSSNEHKNWIGNRRIVYNNKSNPVMQYEPYFSETYQFDSAEQAAAQGVIAILYYDLLGRNFKTELSDGTFTQNFWTPWEQQNWDNSRS